MRKSNDVSEGVQIMRFSMHNNMHDGICSYYPPCSQTRVRRANEQQLIAKVNE